MNITILLRSVLAVFAMFVFQLANAAELELTPTRVSEHVWFFQGESGMASSKNKGFMSNAGFVVTEDQVVVFDALGSVPLGEAMIRAIGNITRLPIKLVVISHYHADHFYGLQAFKALGAEVWAHQNSKSYLSAPVAQERLAQRRQDLFPWVDELTRLIVPDRTLAAGTRFKRGGIDFEIIDVHGSHADDDIMLLVKSDEVLFAGDLFFSGRIPFVGDANTGHWLLALDKMLDSNPRVVIPGHGNASSDPRPDMEMTKGYLQYLRAQMGRAVKNMQTFDEAYDVTDWSKYQSMPAFDSANRLNAYGVFIDMESSSLSGLE